MKHQNKSQFKIIVDALAKSSSAPTAAWPELIGETPISSKATVVRNLPVVLCTCVIPALVPSMSGLVVALIRHDVGELGLVMVLVAFII